MCPTCGLSGGQPGRSDAQRQEEEKPEAAPQSRHSSGRRGETQSSKARLRQHPPFACCPAERRPPTPQEAIRQLPAADLSDKHEGHSQGSHQHENLQNQEKTLEYDKAGPRGLHTTIPPDIPHRFPGLEWKSIFAETFSEHLIIEMGGGGDSENGAHPPALSLLTNQVTFSAVGEKNGDISKLSSPSLHPQNFCVVYHLTA